MIAEHLLSRNANHMKKDNNGNTCLHHMVMSGACGAVEVLLRGHLIAGEDAALLLKERNEVGRVPLHYARDGHMVRLLLHHRADPMVELDTGWTTVHCAAAEGWPSALEALLEALPDMLEKTVGEGATPLILCGQWGNPQGVALLVSRRADVTAKTSSGETALWNLACELDVGHSIGAAKSAVIALLEANADVNEGNRNLSTPLHVAKNAALIDFLGKRGAETDLSRQNSLGWTPGALAAENGPAARLEALLSLGLDVQEKNSKDVTLLHRACRQARPDAARLLLDRGADSLAATRTGAAALHFAATSPPVLESLLRWFRDSLGEDHMQDLLKQRGGSEKDTPLFIAIKSGARRSARLLLEARADLNVADKDDLTPIFWCRDAPMLRELVAARADVNARGRARLTPLAQAVSYGRVPLVRALVECAADLEEIGRAHV